MSDGVSDNQNNPTKDEIEFILKLFKFKKLKEATKEIEDKLIKYPKSSILFNIMGAILFDQNKLKEAIDNYNISIKINPNYSQAYNNLGICFYKLNKINDSIYNYKKAIEIQPKDPKAHNNLGVAFTKLNEYKKSIACYKTAIEINPSYADAYNNLGTSFRDLGQYEKSINYYEKATNIEPEHAEAHNNLGTLFKELREFKKSINHYKKAISIKPNSAESYSNLGNVYSSLGEYNKGIDCHKKSASIDPNYPDAYYNLGTLFEELNEFDKASAEYQKAIIAEPKHSSANSNLLFNICWTESRTDYLEVAKKYSKKIKKYDESELEKIKSKKEKIINVGFVSGDFRNHPVTFFLIDTLHILKKKNIKFFAYSNNIIEDDTTKLLKKSFSKWTGVFYKTDKELINIIRKDKIDILFDLSGHTANNRLPIFRNRSAPVQVSWCGWLASTGIKEIDYLIGDKYATPLADQKKFTEKIYQLKKIWQCLSTSVFKEKPPEFNTNDKKNIIFGSFVNNIKINEEVIDTWAKILNKNPSSKLFLKCGSFDIPKSKKNFITRLNKRININQLILEGRSPRQKYLNCYNNIDIVLDVFSAPGATTSFEASYMGTPILTLNNEKGSWFRTGVSINSNLNMIDWISRDKNEYINKALNYSNNKQYLINLKSELKNLNLESNLFNVKSFSEDFYEMLLNIVKN